MQIVAPAAEYLACTHASHAALPDAALYVPATQAVHGPPFGPVNPTLQVQEVSELLPLGDVLDAGQALHASVPVVFLYFPATHVAHDVADRSDRY